MLDRVIIIMMMMMRIVIGIIIVIVTAAAAAAATTATTTRTITTRTIALKGGNRDFYNLLTAPRTVSNTYAQVARAQSRANHVQHIECLSRAACRVPHGTKGQVSYQV